jgi:hypothetical protein
MLILIIYLHYNGTNEGNQNSDNMLTFLAHLNKTTVTGVDAWCDSVYLHVFLFTIALPAYSGPWPLIQFHNHFSQRIGLLGRVINPSQGLYLNTWQHKHRINVYTHQTSMPWVGFEPTIPASERTNTVHALDRAATVTCVPSSLVVQKENSL